MRPAEPPPTPTRLPPKRQALRDHFDRMDAIQQELANLNAPIAAVQVAEAALKDAMAAIHAIGELEAEAWKSYILAGASGRPPEPMTQRRRERAANAAEAEARLSLARQAADGAEARVAEANERCAVLSRQLAPKVDAAVLECAEQLGKQLCEAAALGAAAEAALCGISDALASRGCGHGVSRITELINGGVRGARLADERAAMQHHNFRLRQEWNKLPELLGRDPSAEFELSPYDYGGLREAAE